MTTRIRIVWAFVLLLSFIAVDTAHAQSSSPRLQVGGQVAASRETKLLGSPDDLRATRPGFGAQASYELMPWLSIDGTFSFFPHNDFDLAVLPTMPVGLVEKGQRLEGFAGVKAGIRRNRVGFFGKARPGVQRVINGGTECRGDICALILLAVPTYRAEFAMDLGGVFEFYPSARTFARFDLGTTMVRHNRDLASPCSDCTTRNLSSSIGAGFRF